jgi:putative hydrolase of the HAD superfamily
MRDEHQTGNEVAPRIRAVLLDYGEVLCQRPKVEALRGMASELAIDPARFIQLYGTSRDPYDQGVLSAEEYWKDFAHRIGVQVDARTIARLRELDTEMWSVTSAEMTGWVGMLKGAGVITALLSNMQHDMGAYARKNFDWFGTFDHQFLSCEVGLIKPDPAIFQHCIERMGVQAQETLFVDDREPNVSSAKSVGIRAIQFQNVEQLRQELSEVPFTVLPPRTTGRV